MIGKDTKGKDAFSIAFSRHLSNRLDHALPQRTGKPSAYTAIDNKIRHLSFFRTISASKSRDKASLLNQPVDSAHSSKIITPNRSKLTIENRTNSVSSLQGKNGEKSRSLGVSRPFARSGQETPLHWPAKDLTQNELAFAAAKLNKTRSTLFQKLQELSVTRGSKEASQPQHYSFISNKKVQNLDGIYSSLEKKTKDKQRSLLDVSGLKKVAPQSHMDFSKPFVSVKSSANSYNIQLFMKKEPKHASASFTGLSSSKTKSFADDGKENQLRLGHQYLLELNSPLLKQLGATKSLQQPRVGLAHQPSTSLGFRFLK